MGKPASAPNGGAEFVQGILRVMTLIEAIGFAYSMKFSAATLSMGRELSGNETGTGFQSAIMPPWQTYFTLTLFVAIPTTLGLTWWQFGIGRAILGFVTILIGVGVSRAVLPSASADHFRNLI